MWAAAYFSFCPLCLEEPEEGLRERESAWEGLPSLASGLWVGDGTLRKVEAYSEKPGIAMGQAACPDHVTVLVWRVARSMLEMFSLDPSRDFLTEHKGDSQGH